MKDKKKLLIGTLCGLILIMAVGYALLGQNLSISGTSSITSNWQVEITNITEKEKSIGTTTNSTSKNATAASFNTSLTSPGDYAIYEVTVTNKGTLDAILSAEPSVTTGNNTAIVYELSGIEQGDKLPATTNNTKTFTIKVQYNPSTTTQPSNLTSDIEVTLSYEQDFSKEVLVEEETTNKMYLDDYEVVGLLVEGDGYCIADSFVGKTNICFPKQTQCESAATEYGASCFRKNIKLSDLALVESTNESFYLKYDINEGIVSNTYACFSDNGKEYCVEPEKYEENVYLMNKVFVNDYDLSCSSDMYNKKDKQYCWLPALYRQDANGKISGTICSQSDNVLALYDDGNVVLSPAGDIILHLYIKDNGISGASD